MMRKIYNIICGLLVLILLFFGCYSLIDKDPVYSETEASEVKTFPQITVSGLLSGSFTEELVEYYADTFPFREQMLEGDRIVGSIFDFADLDQPETE